MTYPRSAIVSLADTPYYHCIGRCVRRSHLCGEDRLTGRSFEHRRGWILERLRELTEAFAIDLCAYALMSNHYHLVVHIDAGRAGAWSDEEVIARWTSIHSGPPLVRNRGAAPLSAAELAQLAPLVVTWRARLCSLSWFMRELNKPIADRANREDKCSGHFWEGRFKCQALLDSGALLTAMAYVDLNPIRAGAAENLQGSDFTSVQARLFEIARGAQEVHPRSDATAPPRLQAFSDADCAARLPSLPFNLQDYLQLVDSTGRIAHPFKRGVIAPTELPILEVLGIDPKEWLATITQMQRRFELALGSPLHRQLFAAKQGRHWHRGQQAARRLYRLATG